MLHTGFVSCGVVVLTFDLLLKRGPYYSEPGLVKLFHCVALQCLLGLLAAGRLLQVHWKKLLSSADAGWDDVRDDDDGSLLMMVPPGSAALLRKAQNKPVRA